MRFPKSIKSGATIGFVAPAFGCNVDPYKSAFQNTQKHFTQMGYKLDIGPNCYESKGIGISNTPQLCGKELTKYYCSPDNDMLISCGGGELMCETMSYVDFDRIAAAPAKWFTGYSDNTNFAFLLETLCDTASVYGPCAAAYGMEPQHKCLRDALEIFEGSRSFVENYDKWEKEGLKDEEHPLLPYNCTEDNIMKAFAPCDKKSGGEDAASISADSASIFAVDLISADSASIFTVDLISADSVSFKGRLIGGCMDCLTNLVGTRFDKVEAFLEKYKEDGFVWFLESCDLNVFSMRRAMWQMYEAGWFKYSKGFIIGRPLHFKEEMMGLDQYNAITETVEKLNIPVIMDCDLGHLPPAMPIICGSMANVTFKNNKLRIEMNEE